MSQGHAEPRWNPEPAYRPRLSGLRYPAPSYPVPSYPADGDKPATASAKSIPMGITAGAGTVIPLST